jgi:hypothetical protein
MWVPKNIINKSAAIPFVGLKKWDLNYI